LSWLLPKLITEKDISAGNLDKLRSGLTELVLAGAEWNNNKWPHTRTKRPDLVPALLAACNRQFRMALEIATPLRSTNRAVGNSPADPPDEHRQPVVGGSAYPW
jgi:hypothetical protein